MDFYALLNRKVGKLTLLSVLDPANRAPAGTSRSSPSTAGAESELLYERWVRQRRAEVDSLSHGTIAYVHVRSMNDASMRTVFDEVMGRGWGKKAVIVDTRFNGGGNIHEQLSDFLSGKKYFDVIPHGQHVGVEPMRQVDEAVHRPHQRERLLRRAPLPSGVQAQGDRQDAGDAGARHRDVRVVGEPDRPDARVRDPHGRMAHARRALRRGHAARAGHPGAEWIRPS